MISKTFFAVAGLSLLSVSAFAEDGLFTRYISVDRDNQVNSNVCQITTEKTTVVISSYNRLTGENKVDVRTRVMPTDGATLRATIATVAAQPLSQVATSEDGSSVLNIWATDNSSGAPNFVLLIGVGVERTQSRTSVESGQLQALIDQLCAVAATYPNK